MKKSTKVWLGLATIWPFLYMCLFMGSILSIILFAGLQDGNPPVAGSDGPNSILFPLGFMGLFAVHMVTILGTLALTVFYIIRVIKTERLDQNMKIVWMLMLFFLGMVAQPVFWYLYIWRDVPGLSQGTLPSALGTETQTSWTRQTASAPREASYVPPPQPPDWR